MSSLNVPGWSPAESSIPAGLLRLDEFDVGAFGAPLLPQDAAISQFAQNDGAARRHWETTVHAILGSALSIVQRKVASLVRRDRQSLHLAATNPVAYAVCAAVLATEGTAQNGAFPVAPQALLARLRDRDCGTVSQLAGVSLRVLVGAFPFLQDHLQSIGALMKRFPAVQPLGSFAHVPREAVERMAWPIAIPDWTGSATVRRQRRIFWLCLYSICNVITREMVAGLPSVMAAASASAGGGGAPSPSASSSGKKRPATGQPPAPGGSAARRGSGGRGSSSLIHRDQDDPEDGASTEDDRTTGPRPLATPVRPAEQAAAAPRASAWGAAKRFLQEELAPAPSSEDNEPPEEEAASSSASAGAGGRGKPFALRSPSGALSDAAVARLAEDGFLVLDAGFVPSPEAIAALRAASDAASLSAASAVAHLGGFIFNDTLVTDPLLQKGRGQVSIERLGRTGPQGQKQREALLPLAHAMYGILGRLLPAHTPNNAVVLRSLPGCKQQLPHADYRVPFWGVSHDRTALAAILSCEPGTRLCVWRSSCPLFSALCGQGGDPAPGTPRLMQHSTRPMKMEVLELPPGCMLLFRGDLVHAGAAYSADNVRLHVYCDPEGFSHSHAETGALCELELPWGATADSLFPATKA